MKKILLSSLLVFISILTAIASGHVVTISSQSNVGCTGSTTGSATVTVTGGVGPFTYSWNPGTQTTTSVTGLTAGTYIVTVTDQNDLSTAMTTVSITQPASSLGSTISALSNIGCTGDASGTSTVTGTGGTPSYSFSWSPGGQTTPTVTGLTAGTYNVIITDMNGCTKNQAVTITQPATALTIGVSSVTNATCGQSNGSASTTIIGGTPGYIYNWAPNGFSNGTATYLSATTYTVTIQDNNGCIATTLVTVGTQGGALAGITVAGTVYKETCLATGDGAIDITLSGSPGPFTYLWSNGATTEDITNVISNTYTVTIFDASMNCLPKTYSLTANGSNCGTLSGNIFNDINLDCIENSGDVQLPRILVIANPGNFKAFTNYYGDYIFNDLSYGTYTLTQQMNSSYIFPTCTTTLNASLNAGNKNITNLNFEDTIAFSAKDVEVWAASKGIVPGFACSMIVRVENYTQAPASGMAFLTLPAGFSAQVTSGPAGFSIIGDTIRWSYSNLSFSTDYEVFFNVPVNTPLGSFFNACATATVIGGDTYPPNNSFCYQRTVNGAFDPNNKSVTPIGQGPQGDITTNDKTLTYNINFQNTGNGPAVNIVVKDTLSDKLDISTLQMIGASHNYMLDVMPGNVLRWKFNNIMLIDSGSNQPASHGWIAYKINQKVGNQPGDKIKNTAYIYFDFNSAVVTNTTVNTITTPTVIQESSSSNAVVKVYPNPFSDNTTFVIQSNKLNETYSFELVDVLGKQVRSMKEITVKEFQISRNGLENGIYFYKIYSAESLVGIGKLVVK